MFQQARQNDYDEFIEATIIKCLFKLFKNINMKINQSLRSSPKFFFMLLMGFSFIIPKPIAAQTDRGFTTAPYVRYEAEDGIKSSGAILYSSPQVKASLTATEASGRKYIGLAKTGDYVKWAVNNVADGITLRFNIPDSTDAPGNDGFGKTGELSFYVNGNKVSTQQLSSWWAYQYFYNYNPSNVPSGRPHMRFDEIHFRLPVTLQIGDTLKIQKDTVDNVEYGIDFVEIEQVPAKIDMPSGYLSVADYKGITSLVSINNCITAAINAGKNVYIPAGKYIIDQRLYLNAKNLKITGAGIWYTELNFTSDEPSGGGISASNTTTNVEISNFYLPIR